ncbi:MAG: DUF357 domain-containing protein [Euryarchaeota archaeon]|nr:DUF357 domain-containing protein [Euryarchaeota archaeon]
MAEGAADRIPKERLEKYLAITREALGHVKIAAHERSHLRRSADEFLEMARAYYEDAMHFSEKGDMVNAFACVNYAHGWLDAGARIGLFEVSGKYKLFALD